eukprot:scaffold10974_cov37-Tisochrysis_lutea.AAC.1
MALFECALGECPVLARAYAAQRSGRGVRSSIYLDCGRVDNLVELCEEEEIGEDGELHDELPQLRLACLSLCKPGSVRVVLHDRVGGDGREGPLCNGGREGERAGGGEERCECGEEAH